MMKFFKKKKNNNNNNLIEELHDNIFRLEENNYELQREIEHWKKEAEMYKDWWIKVLKDTVPNASGLSDCSLGKHKWKCCGVSTVGSTYYCESCGLYKTEHYDVDKSNKMRGIIK